MYIYIQMYTPSQMAGGSVGIAVGCVLGMLPLLFIDGKKGDREESPRYGEYVNIYMYGSWDGV